MTKIIIYTAIIGGYDKLPPIVNDDNLIEYYCFSDELIITETKWNCVKVPNFFEDKKQTVNYLKSSPHLLFNWDCIVVWIDANVEEINISSEKIYSLLGGEAIAMTKHPFRSDIYSEAAIVAEMGLDNRNKTFSWVKKMHSIGMPPNKNLNEGWFIIRDLRNPKTHLICKTWWIYIINESRRDQLSLSFSLWNHGLDFKVIPLDFNKSMRGDTIKRSIKEHHNSIERFPQNVNSNNIDILQKYCWVNFVQPFDYHIHIYHHEFLHEEILKTIRAINSKHNSFYDGYFFIDKNELQEYTVFDIRRSWKREYLVKSVMPFRCGIEIGFNAGHSACLIMSKNPFLKLFCIEPKSTSYTDAFADVLSKQFPSQFELHKGETIEIIESFNIIFDISDLDFIHFNLDLDKNIDIFWSFLEWYLCSEKVKCYVIFENAKHKSICQLLNYLENHQILKQIEVSIPAIDENKFYQKIETISLEKFNEIKISQHESFELQLQKFIISQKQLNEENTRIYQENQQIFNEQIFQYQEKLLESSMQKELLISSHGELITNYELQLSNQGELIAEYEKQLSKHILVFTKDDFKLLLRPLIYILKKLYRIFRWLIREIKN